MAASRAPHQSIRKTPASWEFENYAAFKEALRANFEMSREFANRHARKIDLSNVPLTKNLLEYQISELMKTMTIQNYAPTAGGGVIPKYAIEAADVLTAQAQFNDIIQTAKAVGFLDEDRLKKFNALADRLKIAVDKGERIGSGSNKLTSVVGIMLGSVLRKFLAEDDNIIPIFEDAIKKNLPEGVTLRPRKVRKEAVQMKSAISTFTVTPRTDSSAKLNIDVQNPIKTGTKYYYTKFQLGQLTQGLTGGAGGSSPAFFGTLRYFWYTKQVSNEIRALLVARYMNNFTKSLAFFDRTGKTTVITPDLLENMIKGLMGQNKPGASDKMKKDRMPNASQRDIAVRTWIESKNIPAAQAIQGSLRYSLYNS